jgi:hypothetical protein
MEVLKRLLEFHGPADLQQVDEVRHQQESVGRQVRTQALSDMQLLQAIVDKFRNCLEVVIRQIFTRCTDHASIIKQFSAFDGTETEERLASLGLKVSARYDYDKSLDYRVVNSQRSEFGE